MTNKTKKTARISEGDRVQMLSVSGPVGCIGTVASVNAESRLVECTIRWDDGDVSIQLARDLTAAVQS